MKLFLAHLVSGWSIFSGSALLVVSVGLSVVSSSRKVRRVVPLVALLGAVLVVLSASPLPLWLYLLWTAVGAGWVFAYLSQDKPHAARVIGCALAVLIVTVTVVIVEWSWQRMPKLPDRTFRKVFVIGDSISAGLASKNEKVWPAVLQEKLGARASVTNLAVAGAKVKGAIRQAKRIDPGPALILLEIGGNDLLSNTPADQFERDLKNLLDAVADPTRTVIMFELPLMPFTNGYGRIQRRLSRELNVQLIPKRYLTAVLCWPGNTGDFLHLSNQGHWHMTERLWPIVRHAIPADDF